MPAKAREICSNLIAEITKFRVQEVGLVVSGERSLS